MGIFSKMSSVETFSKSKYFQEGIYIVKLKDVKMIQNRHNNDMIVIETEVLESQSDHPNAPVSGESAAHIFGLKNDMGLPTWKGFLCAAFGDEVEGLNDEEWEELSDNVLDKGVLNGTEMYLEAFMIKTKEKGNDFTVHTWVGPADENTYKKFA